MEQPAKDRVKRGLLQVLRFFKWVVCSGATGVVVGAVPLGAWPSSCCTA